MSTLHTILSGRGKRLFVLTAIMMLLVTTYRPFIMEGLSADAKQIHYEQVQTDPAADEHSGTDHLTYVSAAYEAIVPIVKIQIAVMCSAIFELQLIEEIVESVDIDLPLPQSSYFRILFRTFISPNAP